MRLGYLAFLTIVLMQCAFVFAQTQPTDSDADKEKKKKEQDERVMKMLDQAVSDGGMLRLANNRAIVYAITADMYWKYDEKRARELFKNSAGEIITYNQEREKEKKENPDAYADIFDFDETRSQILPLAAKHDAELAFDMLLQTRPAKLAELMAKAAAPNTKPASDMMSYDPDKSRVKAEVALEQRFALLAADENPDKAVKLIKESIAKGISSNVLALLQKLNKKDPKKAAELAGDVIKKVGDMDLLKNADEMRTALSLLQYAFKPEPPADLAGNKEAKDKLFSFTEDQGKDLAGKVADALLQPSKSMNAAMALTQAMPMIEKFLPAKMPLLKQRDAENQATLPPEVKEMQKRQKLWDENSTPEDLLAQVLKADNEYEKASGYSALSRKIGQIEDDTRAKRLIDQIPDEKMRANALEQYESARITRTANAGRLDEARKMIGGLTKKKTQIQRLVGLALEFQKKGEEKDIVNAKSLMKDAKALTNELAESNEDIADVMEVVKGYAKIDPDIAFHMFEPIIDEINDYVQAAAAIGKYETRDSSFKKGEMTMRVTGNQWESPLYRYIPQMQSLGKADLDRMITQADRFARTDSRLIVRLFVLQGFLKDDKKEEDPQPEYYY